MNNQQVTLTLPVDSVNTILGALSKAPYEAVADLITTVRHQALSQLQAAQPQPEPELPGAKGAD